jgi:hypothetical protein
LTRPQAPGSTRVKNPGKLQRCHPSPAVRIWARGAECGSKAFDGNGDVTVGEERVSQSRECSNRLRRPPSESGCEAPDTDRSELAGTADAVVGQEPSTHRRTGPAAPSPAARMPDQAAPNAVEDGQIPQVIDSEIRRRSNKLLIQLLPDRSAAWTTRAFDGALPP